jgi:hypothetical protein
MKTKIIASILIIGFIGLAVGYYLFTMKVPDLEKTEAHFELTADELFNAFDENESASMVKYEGQVIAVTGIVSRIKLSESTSNITLDAKNAMAGGINCSFNEIVSNISKGDSVTIKGRCQGFLMDVVLNNCSK